MSLAMARMVEVFPVPVIVKAMREKCSGKRLKDMSLVEFRGGFVGLTYLVDHKRASAEVDPS
jgi:hypothetical protein